MPFLFKYREIKYGEGHFVGAEGISLQGVLVEGELSVGDVITLNSSSAEPIEGVVVRFVESFDEWLGLPFYEMITHGASELCVKVALESERSDISCPSEMNSLD